MVCECASRCLIISVNSIFAIIAVVCSIVGGFLTWNINAVYTLFREHIYVTMLGGMDSEQKKVAIEKIIKMLTPFGLTIFIFGIIVFIICCVGLAGACLNSRCMLTIYLALHGVVLAAEIVVVIIYLARPTIITDNVKLALNESVSNYVSSSSSDVHSSLLTFLMPSLNCCGVMNGSDFDNVMSFQRSAIYNGQNITLAYPEPCCKFDSSFKPIPNCPANFTSQNSNIEQGCWTVLQREVDKYGHIIAYTCVAIIILQILLSIAALVLVCRRDKSADY